MKFFVAFAALVAVAAATSLSKPSSNEAAQLEAILAAIQSPSTNPATAQLLEAMLVSQMGNGVIGPALIEDMPVVGPALIEEKPVFGPALIEPPQHELPIAGPAIVDFPVGASPISTPLVQIIVNVAKSAPAAVLPVPEDDNVIADDVLVAEDSIVDESAGVVVADLPLRPVSPVLIGVPQLPSPAVVLPEDLN